MVSEWTIDTLREHINIVLAERDRAIEKLATETGSRFHDANEWRQTVTHLMGAMVPRSESENQWHGFTARISNTESDVKSLSSSVSDFKASTTQRLEATNEWRQTYGDMVSTMMPRHESEEKFKLLQNQVSDIQQAPYVVRDSMDTLGANLQREIAQVKATLGEVVSDLRGARNGFAEFKAAADQRFHSVNEFRAAMNDQQKTYLPKATWDSGHEMLRSAVESQRLGLVQHSADDQRWQGELRNSIQSLQARMIGATAAVAAIMAVVVALVAILRINA